ncbi:MULTISPECIES: hypothetical protein [unclassified Lentimonas]|uniref:hypothetical protein n=1 Tax=unclassified Lentimonas TaxID=2630993 RepID=UPI001323311F|nr:MULTISPECIES: hypothetical protein [unclassified Lentimonas]CAA6691675.1 Unannotated [Lentimonas sp. CC19]CAA6695992.1 Unannotated [Lentimonas sp. CC10]CAA7070029.1 Unannotated [Lentimonas sp. CC11]
MKMTSIIKPSSLALACTVALASVSHAATITWTNDANNESGWAAGDNWTGTPDNTVPTSGSDSAVVNNIPTAGSGNVWVAFNSDFTIGNGQSLTVATDSGVNFRGSGATLTLATGGTLDLTTGTADGNLGNSFGGGLFVVVNSGATAKVTNLDINRDIAGDPNETATFNASAAGAVTLFEVTDELSIANATLNLDLTALTAGTELGTYELFDYGTIAGTFATVNVTGLEAGQSFTTDYAYDIGGGDLGVAITVIPETGTYALLAGLTGMAFVMLRRRQA